MKRIKALTLLFLLTSCYSYRTVYKLINQKDAYYWTGEVANETYDLLVDNSSESIWFDARLIKNKTDTFYLHGFEKGNNHFTRMRTEWKDSLHNSHIGDLFIWTIGWNADTIEIVNDRDSLDLIPINFMLFKMQKLGE